MPTKKPETKWVPIEDSGDPRVKVVLTVIFESFEDWKEVENEIEDDCCSYGQIKQIEIFKEVIS